jgi:hypothetical protein
MVIAGAALIVTLAGCNSKGDSASGATGSTSSATKVASGSSGSGPSASSGGGTNSGSGGGKKVDVCAVLPVATVAQITDEPLTNAAPDQGASVTEQYGIFNCDYTSDDGTSGVDVVVTTKNGKLGYQSDLEAASSVSAANTTKIPGLGDAAFSAVNGVHALFGDAEIEVSGLDIAASAVGLGTNDSIDKAKTLITTMHDKL